MRQTTIFDVFILFFLSSYGERRFKKLYWIIRFSFVGCRVFLFVSYPSASYRVAIYYYNLILYVCYMQKCCSLSLLNAYVSCRIMCFCIICCVQTNQHVTFCFEILICIKLLQNILVVWKIITNFTLRNITSWQNAIAWRVIYGISSWLTPYIIWSNA